jgi:hypothetical protein
MDRSKIHLWASSAELKDIVGKALVRSFSEAQVRVSSLDDVSEIPTSLVITTDGTATECLHRALAFGTVPRKVLIFGPIDESVADLIGLEIDAEFPFDSADSCAHVPQALPDAPTSTMADESLLAVSYSRTHPLAETVPYQRRHFCRFDFFNEWNNLGYGRIGLNGSIWDLACPARADGAQEIATVHRGEDGTGILYCSLYEVEGLSVLWFNRSAGPVDGLDWAMVEEFFSNWRADELPCNPYLLDVPYGFSGAVTMRLDCDQGVASSLPLLQLYQDNGVPLSLALTTSLPIGPRDHQVIEKVIDGGGAVVSHSHTHPSDWGGTPIAAQGEYRAASDWLCAHVPLSRPDLAVSPFHQNSVSILPALAREGCNAFVGGIIHNDPEYLMARAGRIPRVDASLVSLSQQCMLHGDSYHRRDGDGLELYKQSFEFSISARGLFGYLDHPFSEEYQYGWTDEAERCQVHQFFLSYIGSREGLWRPNLADALDFVRRKAVTRVFVDDGQSLCSDSPAVNGAPSPAISYRGVVSAACDGGLA